MTWASFLACHFLLIAVASLAQKPKGRVNIPYLIGEVVHLDEIYLFLSICTFNY